MGRFRITTVPDISDTAVYVINVYETVKGSGSHVTNGKEPAPAPCQGPSICEVLSDSRRFTNLDDSI